MIAKLLYLITNRKLVQGRHFYTVINEAIKGGVSAIILREKDSSYEDLLPMAVKIKEIIGNLDVKLIINNDLEVANSMKADGFHTSFQNFIKDNVNFNGILGVSVHSLDEAVEVEKLGADYLLFGHIFETDCKKGVPPRGVEIIREIKQNVKIPVIALGGIKPENVYLVMEAGANGVAIMSSIMEAEDSYVLTRKFRIGLDS